MKRIAQRTIASMLLVVVLLAGFGLYVGRYIINGDDWAAFAVNSHVYSDGILSVGTILDRNGVVLAGVSGGQRVFSESYAARRAGLHVVGDARGNIGTGLLQQFDTQLMGYNVIGGVFSTNGLGNTLRSTIDIELCKTAINALNGRKGCVTVYNYITGEVLCMVSAPGFDPMDPPDLSGTTENRFEGAYINRAVSSTYAPGSIFKILTLIAAIETLGEELWAMEFTCDASYEIGYDVITCQQAHGTLDIHDALAHSCNAAFAELALKVGGAAIERVARRAGLLDETTMSGIPAAAGRYDIAGEGTSDLAWSGIGQYTDLVNPLAFARLMGAIANGGLAVNPRIVSSITTPLGLPVGLYGRGARTRLLPAETARIVAEMMRYNVTSFYGDDRFPNLQMCAKSGTAEVADGDLPHAWFVGFLQDPSHPYAFSVIVENSGWGVTVAGAVANEVLQQAVRD